MTVKELLNSFPVLKKVSFIKKGNVIEEIDTSESGSWRAIKAHHDEKVIRVFAMAEDEIRIDSIAI